MPRHLMSPLALSLSMPLVWLSLVMEIATLAVELTIKWLWLDTTLLDRVVPTRSRLVISTLEQRVDGEDHVMNQLESSLTPCIQDTACTMSTVLRRPSSMKVPSGRSKTPGAQVGETKVSPTSKPMVAIVESATCTSTNPSGSRPTWSDDFTL